MSTINAQIADREAKRAKALTDIAQIKPSIGTLQRDLAAIICKGTKQQKANCEGRKSNIRAMISERQTKIIALEQQVALYNKEIADLSAQRENEGKAIEILAQQGQTPAAVLETATSQAQAAQQIAQAEASAIERAAQAEASAASTKNMIMLLIALFVLIVIGVIVKRKFA